MSTESTSAAFGVPQEPRHVLASVLRTMRTILAPDVPIATRDVDVSLQDVAGRSMLDVLGDVDAIVRGASVNPRHPGAVAHMVPPPATVAVLGDLLIGALNQCAFIWEEGPLVARIESEVLRWMARRLTLPDSTAGLLTSGGTASNLLALFLARSVRGVSGARDADRLRIVASDQAHFSIDKAARLLGLAANAVVRVPTDACGRLQAGDVMRAADRVAAAGDVPFCFVATVGTTNAGVVEPVEDYLAAARRFSAWTHLDAAHGGFLALSRRGRHACAAWRAADSVSWDPHKSLFVPFASGTLFVRDSHALQALEFHSEYALQRSDPRDAGYRHFDGSRRFEALKIWMVIRHLGIAGLREFADRNLELAAACASELRRSSRFELIVEPDLNIVCFRFIAPGLDEPALDALNLAIKERLFRSGVVLLSATRVGGRVALRAIFSNPALDAERPRIIVRAIERCGENLLMHGAWQETPHAGIAGYQSAS
jgi:L-2,4-diaminobutyrate decarboxylase